MSNHNMSRVNKKTYDKASSMLYTDYGKEPKYTGPDRQKLQKIKHSNDKIQKGPNPYAGPDDKSDEANKFMDSLE